MNVTSRREHVTSFMRPAPVPSDDETDLEEDACVADPLSDGLLNLWNTTARVNREVFTELFRPVPSNLVHNWNAYSVSRGWFSHAGSVRLLSYRRADI
jgi:phospholipase D1/2